MSANIAVIGAGLIGRSWAIVFAKAGQAVNLYDNDPDALKYAEEAIEHSLADLQAVGLIESSSDVARLINPERSLADAVAGAKHVQECGPEEVDAKCAIFSELESVSPKTAIIASSSSGIMASQFANHLITADRCLVAHPVNPPYLIPLVELSPGPRTTKQTMDRTRVLLESVGQVPVTLKAELPGFVLNRLQGALLNEALRLVQSGYIDSADLDKTVKHGLGLRWAFMGPFETIDLNAPGGILDYASRYASLYQRIADESVPPRWDSGALEAISQERRDALPKEALGSRQRWRDQRLMRLAAHLSNADNNDDDLPS